ncbi:transposase [Endozoicomonas sp. SM1973]|uniref:Transposase n=1 Tax=Spartinivicinus marinus TaxID=2994442 RepID=A0A853I857_9GAMM|nr:transposase [Spartinivicinus marinus]MCX4024709.1 transposase [Spartinivicinus marinus]NYZ66264.1 transposase [Spartinivicinus marinus]
MTRARREQVALDATPFYHCITRCVRRAFLCGEDKLTGCSFEHRRQWIVDRLAELVDIFAIDLCAYAVMSNHYHIVVRIDSHRAEEWSNHEVVERWMKLYNGNFLVNRWLNGETGKAENFVVSEIIQTWRKRLADLSWFMRCLNEFIARKANKEDNCKGRFWESRFKSQALLTEEALLTFMAYVDLNPIRAKLADRPETSDFTSVQSRIQTRQQQKKKKIIKKAKASKRATQPKSAEENKSPMLLPFSGNIKPEVDPTCGIYFHESDYYDLVDWSGRAIRDNKRGSIPAHIPPILQRLGVNENEWLNTMQKLTRQFNRAVGPKEKIQQLSRQLGQTWLKGIRSAQRLFSTPLNSTSV